VVAAKGDMRADIETRKIIHTFILGLKIEYGGPETSR
jgi:hypothetical protein